MSTGGNPTFSPSGYETFVTPPSVNSDPTGVSLPYFGKANTVALPTGTNPASVLVQTGGPEPAFVLISAAAATTTGTAAAGATAVTLASGTSVLVGQAVIGTGIAEGTTVAAISGTALIISRATTASLSTTTLNFVTTANQSNGVMVTVTAPITLAFVASGYISAFCTVGASRSIINVTVVST